MQVAGSGDFYEAVRSESTRLQWYAPEVLKDGEYRYEVFVIVSDEWKEEGKETSQLYRVNDRFTVEDNVIIPWQENLPELGHPLSINTFQPQINLLSQMFY